MLRHFRLSHLVVILFWNPSTVGGVVAGRAVRCGGG